MILHNLGRIGLAAVVAFAVVRVFDPLARWAAYDVGGDRVEHAAVCYLLVLTAGMAFPSLNAWLPAAALIAVGVTLELLQSLPQVIGDGQYGDVLANALGALAASAALWAGSKRRPA